VEPLVPSTTKRLSVTMTQIKPVVLPTPEQSTPKIRKQRKSRSPRRKHRVSPTPSDSKKSTSSNSPAPTPSATRFAAQVKKVRYTKSRSKTHLPAYVHNHRYVDPKEAKAKETAKLYEKYNEMINYNPNGKIGPGAAVENTTAGIAAFLRSYSKK
jgi:hypothetical protein